MDSWATRVGLEVRPTADNVELQAARKLHAITYLEAGYVDNLTENGLIEDPWIPYSDFFVAATGAGEVVGTVRLIRPSPRGLQTFQHAPLFPEQEAFFAELRPDACVEVSSLATSRRGIENSEVAAALYGLVWRQAVLRGHAFMIALMDPRLIRVMRRSLGLPFEAIGPTRTAFGGEVTPTAMYVPDAYDAYGQRFDVQHGQDASLDTLNECVIDLRETVSSFTQVSYAS